MTPKPGESGFGTSTSAHDDLISANLRDLITTPDPPATMVCRICGFKVEKSSDTMDWHHCGEPMQDVQERKAVDDDIIRQILKKGQT